VVERLLRDGLSVWPRAGDCHGDFRPRVDVGVVLRAAALYPQDGSARRRDRLLEIAARPLAPFRYDVQPQAAFHVGTIKSALGSNRPIDLALQRRNPMRQRLKRTASGDHRGLSTEPAAQPLREFTIDMADCADEWQRARHRRPVVLEAPANTIDRVFRHPPIGRELAADDDDDPVAVEQGMTAGDVRGTSAACCSKQWPESRELSDYVPRRDGTSKPG